MTDATAPKIDGRTLRYADRRRELLLASMNYVLEHGLADLSMRPLAKALGITHTSLSAHFGSKENLITEILATLREASKRVRRLPGSDATDTGGPASFDGYDRWWKQWTQDQFLPALRLSFEVFGIALQHPDRYADFLQHVVKDWLEVFEPLLRSCGCPEDEIETMATSAIAHMVGLQADLLATGDRERVDRAHASFLATMEEKRQRWIAAAAAESAAA